MVALETRQAEAARALGTLALVAFVFLSPKLPAQSPAALPEALGALTDDLPAVSATDSVAGVTCFGPHAWPLAAVGGVPVLAAATAGAGRVVVSTQGSQLDAFNLRDPGNRELALRLVRWLGGGRRRPDLAIIGSGALDLAQALELDFKSPYTKADVVVATTESLTPDHLQPLQRWVLDGGALLLVTPHWGVTGLDPRAASGRGSTANRLLAPFGLALDGRRPMQGGTLSFTGLSELLHAGAAWHAVAEGRALSEAQRATASDALAAAAANLDDYDESLIRALRQALPPGSAPPLPDAVRAALGARELAPLDVRWGPWWLAGPFDTGALGRAGRELGKSQRVEEVLADCAADGAGPVLEQGWQSLDGSRPWRQLETEGYGRVLDVGPIDLLDWFTREPDANWPRGWADGAVTYAYRRLELDVPFTVALALAGGNGLVVWVDGKELGSVYRGVDECALAVDLALEPGVHHLVVKSVNADGTWNLRMRGEATAGAPRRAAEIDAAIRRGTDALLRHQLADGSWPSHYNAYGPGFTAWMLYGLARSGIDADHPAMRRGLAYLAANDPPQHVYSICSVTLALTALHRADQAVLQGYADRLVALQDRSGLWNYPRCPVDDIVEPDLHNTMFVALAFDALLERGIEVSRASVRQMLRGALSCQTAPDQDARAFGYRPAASPTRWESERGIGGSMTVAGLTVLLLVREALGEEATDAELARLTRGIEGGRAWVERNLVWGKQPHSNQGHYYWIYGLERVGTLLDVETLGGEDWYAGGSEFLLGAQSELGFWESGHAEVDTVLALLFLNRATGPLSPVPSSRIWRLVASAEVERADSLLIRARRPAVVGEALECWLTDSKVAELEVVDWVARFEGQERVLATVRASEGRGRFAARVEASPTNGFELVARGRTKGGAAIVSAPIVLPPFYSPDELSLAHHLRANLLRGATVIQPTAEANRTGLLAIDGTLHDGWLCWQKDDAPSWRAELRHGVSASRLLLVPLRGSEHGLTRGRVERVRVTLDGVTSFEVDLHADDLRPTEVHFGAARPVESVEVTPLSIDWVDPNAGLAEIVLLP